MHNRVGEFIKALKDQFYKNFQALLDEIDGDLADNVRQIIETWLQGNQTEEKIDTEPYGNINVILVT